MNEKERKTKERKLIEAAQKGDIAAAKELFKPTYPWYLGFLNKPMSVQAQDNQALRAAAFRGHTAMVKLLLDHGADVHAANGDALALAVEYGSEETVKLLLKHGADPRADNHRALNLASKALRPDELCGFGEETKNTARNIAIALLRTYPNKELEKIAENSIFLCEPANSLLKFRKNIPDKDTLSEDELRR